jgi:hypothetical protein
MSSPTITLDAAVWKRLAFFVQGLAFMETLRADYRDAHIEACELAKIIDQIIEANNGLPTLP